MTEISVQIEGLEDLQKQFERLVSLAEQEKYTFRAASYAMTPIVNQARLLAPMAEQAYFRYSKGRVLRKNNLARKKKYAGVAALYSNVAKERVGRGRVEVQPGGLKKAIRKIRVNLDKSKGVALQVRYGKAFYWRFLEYGTPHIRATPFLRPAYEMHKQTALERFKKRYAKYVDDVVKRKAIQEGNE